MTVKELKEKLHNFPDNLEVMIPTIGTHFPYSSVEIVARGLNECDGILCLEAKDEEDVICGEIIPESFTVCPSCGKVEDNPVTQEFTCKKLADLFGEPCNLSPCEDELHDTAEKCEWCDKFCGKATAADCWMRYFEIKHKEERCENNA